MVTKEFLREKLQCSELYAQKLIDSAQGDENKLYDLYLSENLQNATDALLSSNIEFN